MQIFCIHFCISVRNRLLKGFFTACNTTDSIYLFEPWRVSHVGQELHTFSITPDFTPYSEFMISPMHWKILYLVSLPGWVGLVFNWNYFLHIHFVVYCLPEHSWRCWHHVSQMLKWYMSCIFVYVSCAFEQLCNWHAKCVHLGTSLTWGKCIQIVTTCYYI